MAIPEIRFLQSTEIPTLRQFFHEHWRENHILSRDEALLRWQYGHKHELMPDDAEFSFLCVWSETELVGILGFIPVDFSLGDGDIVRGAWLSHWMVLEEYRSSGVGLYLFQRLRSLGIEAIGVQGINDTVKELYRSLGYRIFENVPRFVRILDLDQVEELMSSCGVSVDEDMLAEYCPVSETVAAGYNVQIQDGNFGSDWDAAANRLSHSNYGTVHSAEYLNWRYLAHPSFDYKIFVAYDRSGSPVGAAICRIEQIRDRSEKVLRITDILADPDAASALLAHINRYADIEKVAFVDFYGTSVAAGKLLTSSGYKEMPTDGIMSRLPSRFQPLDAVYVELSGGIWLNRKPELMESSMLYVSKSDGDVDRPN